MDPYLEHPALWPDVHNRLIAELGNTLGPLLRPRYFIRLEERVYLAEPDGLVFVGRPDLSVEDRTHGEARGARRPEAGPGGPVVVEVPVVEAVRETYLEVRAVEAGEVVTVLELLSPANKLAGRGRTIYEEKRTAVLSTRTSLVEIDLVRAGEPMRVMGTPPSSDYRILVSPGPRRPLADLYPFSVQDPIPGFKLPLRPGDDEPDVDVGAALKMLYDKAGYDLSIDYRAAPVPPLSGDAAAWAEVLLRRAGLR